ncbi:MAG TPA: hypothetical protein DD635_01710 [Flavobacteriales bacterium]|nr:hypothetical protein [Flavobacteriales bacterium]
MIVMISKNTNPAKIDPSGFNASGVDHARIQRYIVVMLGLLTIAVFATSCMNEKSCSAYQEVEVAK